MNAPAPEAKSNSPTPQKDDSPTSPPPAMGWTPYAELINGRFAMIGFITLLILGWFSHTDFFTWVGLR